MHEPPSQHDAPSVDDPHDAAGEHREPGERTVPRWGDSSEDLATIDHTPVRGRSTDAIVVDGRAADVGDARRFERVRPHAMGGMGEVWVAVDRQLPREVALKVLQAQHRGDHFKLERFVVEGQVTGLLEHPGIVPVYALGVDVDQQPFYAMRFVRGESLRRAIKRFHDERTRGQRIERHDLAFRALVQRVIDVCYTVAYAHSRGVLHRDLKPDNIMLGKYGETYVVDWGMARIFGEDIADSAPPTEGLVRRDARGGDSATEYGSAMGTPGYMSPEQASGLVDQLTASTDIYSLGAVLYYLLTCRTAISGDSLTDFLERVAKGNYPLPQELEPDAPVGLCAVCLKAMSVSPEARYLSAKELATELEAWLADQPIKALPDSAIERVARFARRHYRWLAPAVIGLSLVTATTFVASLLINRAREKAELAAASEAAAKIRAEANFLKARETVDQWLTGYSEALNDYPGVQQFRQRMLEEAAKEYDQFVLQEVDDDALRIEQGRTNLRLGDIRRRLFDPPAATAAYQQAIRVFEQLPADTRAKQGLAEAWGRIAIAQSEVGSHDDAIASHQRAVSLARDLVIDETAASVEPLALVANLEINRANHLATVGKLEEATKSFNDAITRLKRLISMDPNRLELRTALATALLGVGQVQLALGQAGDARRHLREAIEIAQAVSLLADRAPKQLDLLAMGNLLQASVEGRLGNFVGEAAGYQQAIEAYLTLAQKLPDVPRYQEEAARTQIDLGQVELKLGHVPEAREALQRARQTLEDLAQRFRSLPRFDEARGLAADLAGQVEYVAGQDAAAEVLHRQAIDLLQSLVNDFPNVREYKSRLAVAETHFAVLAASGNRFAEAEAHFEAAQKLLESATATGNGGPFETYATAMLHGRWGETLWLAEKADAAKPHFSSANMNWNSLTSSTADAEYLAAAAKFLVTCPDTEFRELARAKSLAEMALGGAPENSWLNVILARVSLASRAPQEAVDRLTGIITDIESPALEAEKRLLLALAYRQLGENELSRQQHELALAQFNVLGAGDWDLRILRRECERADAR